MDVAKSDWKFVKVKPDPNFDPDKNKRVVDEVIRETEALSRKKNREFDANVKERSEALAKYFEYGQMKDGGSLAQYFGKKYYDHLRGQKTREETMSKDGLTVVDSKGKVLRKPYEVK